MNAAIEYLNLSKEFFPAKQAEEEMRPIDKEISRNLISAGYQPAEIKKTLLSKSFVMKHMSAEEQDKYLTSLVPDDLPPAPSSDAALSMTCGRAYEEEREKFASRFIDLFKQTDARIITAMREKNYSPKEISEAFAERTPLKYWIHSREVLGKYKGIAFQEANSYQQEKSRQDEGRARKLYSFYLRQVHKSSQPSIFLDGSIIIQMLRADGLSLEAVKKAVQSQSPMAEKHGMEYINALFERTEMCLEMYEAIDNIGPISEASKFIDLYRSYAKEYMKKRGIKILSSKDDEIIIGLLKSTGIMTSPARFHAALKGSPVACLPGRNQAGYIMHLTDYFFNAQQQSIKEYPETEALAKAEFARIDARLKEQGIDKGIAFNRPLYDAQIFKFLLRNRHDIANIIKAIISLSPLGLAAGNDGYGAELWSRIRSSVSKEQEIQTFKPLIDSGTAWEEIQQKHISTREIYKSVLKEKILSNPSYIRRLADRQLDIDILETIKTRYPEISMDELKECISTESPRALLPDAKSASYPDSVINELSERIKANNSAKTSLQVLQEEYNIRQGLAMEGRSLTANLQLNQAGRLCIGMLNDGRSEEDARQAVLMTAESGTQPPAEYADEVLRKSKECLERIARVASPPDNAPGIEEKLDAEYLKYMNRHIEDPPFTVQPRDDIDFAREKILSGSSEEEIRDALEENSPVVTEPGRDASYLDYIIANANRLIEEEKEKLASYKAVPYDLHMETPEKEYARHQKDIQGFIQIPYSPAFDVIIAEAMLLQSYPAAEIAKALASSPVFQGADYAARTITSAMESINGLKEIQQHDMAAEFQPEQPEILQQVRKISQPADDAGGE